MFLGFPLSLLIGLIYCSHCSLSLHMFLCSPLQCQCPLFLFSANVYKTTDGVKFLKAVFTSGTLTTAAHRHPTIWTIAFTPHPLRTSKASSTPPCPPPHPRHPQAHITQTAECTLLHPFTVLTALTHISKPKLNQPLTPFTLLRSTDRDMCPVFYHVQPLCVL